MAKDMMYQAMKDIVKKKGIKLSAEQEAMEFDCDGAEETYTEIAEKTVEHMEKWYREEYVIERVDSIIENLEKFWNEVPGIDELDMG